MQNPALLKTRICKRLAWPALAALFLFPSLAFPDSFTPPTIRTLATDRGWLLLGAYQPNLFGQQRSEVIDLDFFLSPEGARDPARELEATLAAMQGSDVELRRKVFCDHPARVRWLQSQLRLTLERPACPELEAWKKNLSAKSLSLVIPTSSMDSALSIFSHTFLKINSSKLSPESTLHTTVSYSAALDPNSGIIELALRGVFGGYLGHFGTPGFFAEIQKYGYQDSREIYEYDLNFTPAEIDQMLNELWEIRAHSLRYYFFTKNCSYYALTLLEIARPGLEISDRYHGLVIPYATVQDVFWKTDLVSGVHALPSKETKRVRSFEALSLPERPVYQQVIKDPAHFDDIWKSQAPAFDQAAQVRILDALNFYLLRIGDPVSLEARSNLLAVRAQIHAASAKWEAEPLSAPPHLGHGPFLAATGVLHRENQDFAFLRYRLVSHDLLNKPEGHNSLSSVEAFDLQLEAQKNQVNLHRLGILSALVLRPEDFARPGASWLVRSSIDQRQTRDGELHPLFTNEFGEGISWAERNNVVYALLTANSALHPALEKGYQLGAGGLLGARAELGADTFALAELWWKSFIWGESDQYLDTRLSLSHAFSRKWELRAETTENRHQRSSLGFISFLF